MHACMHTCEHTNMHTNMHAYIHAYMHACMHACIHAYIHTYVHTPGRRTYLPPYIRLTYIHTASSAYDSLYVCTYERECCLEDTELRTNKQHSLSYVHTTGIRTYVYTYVLEAVWVYSPLSGELSEASSLNPKP
jgi:hypothetical protein